MSSLDDMSKEELKEIAEAYFVLCEKLHNKSDLIPEKLMEEIEDVLYGYYEP